MKKIFTHHDPLQIQLMKGVLTHHGIPCVIPGEQYIRNPFGRRGRFLGVMSLCVVNHEDEEKALRIIRETSTPAETDPLTWHCEGCGEDVEEQFTDCWKCGRQRTC